MRIASMHGRTAIAHNDLAGDEIAVGRSQKDQRPRQILRRLRLFQKAPCHSGRPEILQTGPRNRLRQNEPRRDGVAKARRKTGVFRRPIRMPAGPGSLAMARVIDMIAPLDAT